MPLTDELGNEVIERVARIEAFKLPRHFTGGSFEVWLSRIAEDQPDLYSADNLRNRYIFGLCSDALAEVLNERVAKASADAISNYWLQDLLHALHVTKATIITFNRDVLIELAVNAANIMIWENTNLSGVTGQTSINRNDILGGFPELPPSRYRFGPPNQAARLLKLHGSTNWYWQPGDASGASVIAWMIDGESQTVQTKQEVMEELARSVLGRVPTIIPPSAAKAEFYRSPLLSKLWQDARTALSAGAGNLYLVGYSLPLTDLVTLGMLRETVGSGGGGERRQIVVVNPEASSIIQALVANRVTNDRISTTASVESFARAYVEKVASRFVLKFRTASRSDGPSGLVVGCSADAMFKVQTIRGESNGVVVLDLKDEPLPNRGTNQSVDADRRHCSTVDLFKAIDLEPDVHVIIAALPDGTRSIVIAATEHETSIGAGNGRWRVLITTPLVRIQWIYCATLEAFKCLRRRNRGRTVMRVGEADADSNLQEIGLADEGLDLGPPGIDGLLQPGVLRHLRRACRRCVKTPASLASTPFRKGIQSAQSPAHQPSGWLPGSLLEAQRDEYAPFRRPRRQHPGVNRRPVTSRPCQRSQLPSGSVAGISTA